jgi:hypothetical protein
MQPTTPSPWKSLTRFLLRSLYTPLLATLLWSLWYAYAAHRLNTQLAEYRARGEPASPQDFVGKALPPSENAYALAIEAADALKLTTDELELVDSPTSTTRTMLPLSPEQMETARKMLIDHAPTLELAHTASETRECVAPYNPKSMDANVHGLSQFRRLSNFLRIVAFYHHQNQRDDLVLDDLQEMRMLTTTASAGHFIIHHLVSIAIDANTSQALLQMAPDFEIAGVNNPHGASREQIRQTALEFLDREQFQETLRSSLKNERIYDSIYINALLASSDRWLLPLFRLDAVRAMENADVRIRAVSPGVPSYPTAKAHFPEERTSDSNLQAAAHLLSEDSASMNRAVLLHYRAMTDREAAGLSLLIRLYELDHAAELPARLVDLTPTYLPTLPPDPFQNGGTPFIYDAKRRIFYSVGQNGTDDGGPATSRGYPDWSAKDTVYSLNRPLPPPPSTTEGSGAFVPEPAPPPN